jgi:signal transduction histidine kinase
MNTIEEFLSHNLNYKALVNKEGDAYEVIIYHWNEEDLDGDGKPTWERIAGPFPVENLPAAEALAKTQLADLAGETEDIEIDESVTAVIESENKNALALKAMEQAAEMKSNLLATMSHEIRTPMQSVFGFLELIAEEKPEQKILDMVESLQEATKRIKENKEIIQK